MKGVGLYEKIMSGSIAIGPIVIGESGHPGYRGRLNLSRAQIDKILRVAEGIPVKTVDSGYLAQKGRIGEEKGNGVAYIADNLVGTKKEIAEAHERIGASMSILGYGHDDPTIAAIEAEYFLEKCNPKALIATVGGARNVGWFTEGESLAYIKKAYEAGLGRG